MDGIVWLYDTCSCRHLVHWTVCSCVASLLKQGWLCLLQANGAGKSTLIKLLTGEMEPQEGIVWKHPNTRVAYVAQHAFHHVEQVRRCRRCYTPVAAPFS